MQKSIILVGIKHCGKSTQGYLLSQELNLPFFDTDDVLAAQEHCTPRELFSTQGKDAFYKAECKAARHIYDKLMSEKRNAIIATGGGICNNQPAIDTLHPLGTIVFLCAEEKIAADRIVREISFSTDGRVQNAPSYIAEKNPRSEADVRALFHTFYEERTKKYQSLADITVFMRNVTKQANTKAILSALGMA